MKNRQEDVVLQRIDWHILDELRVIPARIVYQNDRIFYMFLRIIICAGVGQMSIKTKDLLNHMKNRESRDVNDDEFSKLIEKEIEMYNAMTPTEQRAFDRELRQYEDQESRVGKVAARKSSTPTTPSVNRIVKNIEAMGRRPKLKF